MEEEIGKRSDEGGYVGQRRVGDLMLDGVAALMRAYTERGAGGAVPW